MKVQAKGIVTFLIQMSRRVVTTHASLGIKHEIKFLKKPHGKGKCRHHRNRHEKRIFISDEH